MPRSPWTRDPSDLLRVTARFSLASVDPRSTPGILADKTVGARLLEEGRDQLRQLQEKLFAESRFGGTRSLLVVVQGMDTSGKGGIVEHVLGGFSPEAVSAHAFKQPTRDELAHDFLWRIRSRLPSPGIIGVFDRSHYEDVLIARVHALAPPEVIAERYERIRDFERELTAAGTTIVKVMLHLSAEEQLRRLAARLAHRSKQWKYNPGDLDEHALWPAYQEAYQLALQRTSTGDAPWFAVPADRKWYARLAVQRIVQGALAGLDPRWPDVDYDVEAEKRRLAAG